MQRYRWEVLEFNINTIEKSLNLRARVRGYFFGKYSGCKCSLPKFAISHGPEAPSVLISCVVMLLI